MIGETTGECQPGTAVVCEDNDVCTTNTCNHTTGACTFPPIAGCCNFDADCNDGVDCTDDACDTTQHACSHTDTCTGGTFCNGGVTRSEERRVGKEGRARWSP